MRIATRRYADAPGGSGPRFERNATFAGDADPYKKPAEADEDAQA